MRRHLLDVDDDDNDSDEAADFNDERGEWMMECERNGD